ARREGRMPGAQDTLKARPPPWSTAWAGTHRLRARYGWQGDGAACLVDADSGMARLEGFEPPTNGFGSHYSIRLSYRRADRHFPLSGELKRGARTRPWRCAVALLGPPPWPRPGGTISAMSYERFEARVPAAPSWRERPGLYWKLMRADRPIGWLLLLWP